jgi:ABC-type Mn2+/Zn2+ transport system permease subunit
MKKTVSILVMILIAGSLLAQEPDTLHFVQGKMRSPALAIGLSAVIPGGGQLYNQKWLKSGVFMGTELALGAVAYYHYQNHANGINETLFGQGQPLQVAKEFTWFFAAVYVYSLMDAYVDAHLSNFPNERLILEPDPKINGVQLSFQF